MSFCEHCGKKADEGDAFCIGCGQKLLGPVTTVGTTTHQEELQSSGQQASPPASQPQESVVSPPVASPDDELREICAKIGFHSSSSSEVIAVDNVFAGTLAERVGLQRGDVIVRVGDVPVASTSDITVAFRGIDVGHQFTLEVQRGQNSVVLTANPTPRPTVAAPAKTNTMQVTYAASRQKEIRSSNRRSASGSLILGIIVLVAGLYFGKYAVQNLACNFASAVGANQPPSCAWYTIAYGARDWCIGFGALFIVVSLIGLASGQSRR
jgi:hypothetical protein